MTTYCDYCNTHPEDIYNRTYHDDFYGFPISDDNGLFERLILEINQAGLSWITILKKAENFHRAYDGFDVEKVASYGDADFARLMDDAGIIRNRLKISAAINNAKSIKTLSVEYGSFKDWLDFHHPSSVAEWTKLFKNTFVLTGEEIVKEFLTSTGYLPGAHDENCPAFKETIKRNPAWAQA